EKLSFNNDNNKPTNTLIIENTKASANYADVFIFDYCVYDKFIIYNLYTNNKYISNYLYYKDDNEYYKKGLYRKS
ncbi:hypothetical protein, partial [Mycoplasmopsis bovis]|uniref:hypothetical protein n=1 Tax=Mycoplasmopsis bovis TaxID=28903 RepID=UPI003D266C0D